MLNEKDHEYIDDNTRIMIRHCSINPKRAQDIPERKELQD